MADSDLSGNNSPFPEGTSEPIGSNPITPETVPLPPPERPPQQEHFAFIHAPIYQCLSSTDQSLLRLRRLLSTTSGLETFLATANSVLDVLAYFKPLTRPPVVFLHSLSKVVGPLKNTVPRVPSPSGEPRVAISFKILASLISETRTTLRLAGLLSLYTWLRDIQKYNGKQDRYLRVTLLAQCISYIIFQFAENIAFLTDRRIISPKWLEKRGGSSKWWLLSSRAWCAGIVCEFLVLFRKAFIERERRNKESGSVKGTGKDLDVGFDRKWWNDFVVASCWLPVCLHYSLKDGLRGMNAGVLGTLGVVAGAQSFLAQWAEIDGS